MEHSRVCGFHKERKTCMVSLLRCERYCADMLRHWMGNPFSCENTLISTTVYKTAPNLYLTITITIIHVLWKLTPHASSLYSLSLSLSSICFAWAPRVLLKPQRCNYNSTFHYISFPDHILWRFGIEHVCTSGRTLSAWLAAAIVDASSPSGFAMTAILSVKSPREFAWFAR